MENIFFIVLVVVVGLVRLLSMLAEKKKNAEAARRAGPPPAGGNTPVQRAPAQSEEERIRRFMEALGVPTTSAPPPPVQPRPATPQATPERKRQFMPVDPFPIPRTHRAEPTPPVVVAAPPVVPAAPPPLPPPPLPTRETTVFAEPTPHRGERASAVAEFEVQDLLGAAAEREDAPTQKARRAGEQSKRPRGIAARLANAEGLRDAIVLREIFGPPRSMQPLDPGR